MAESVLPVRSAAAVTLAKFIRYEITQLSEIISIFSTNLWSTFRVLVPCCMLLFPVHSFIDNASIYAENPGKIIKSHLLASQCLLAMNLLWDNWLSFMNTLFWNLIFKCIYNVISRNNHRAVQRYELSQRVVKEFGHGRSYIARLVYIDFCEKFLR
jgi:hypothetical protein